MSNEYADNGKPVARICFTAIAIGTDAFVKMRKGTHLKIMLGVGFA